MTALLTTLIWSLTEKNKKVLFRLDVCNRARIFHLKQINPKWDQRAPVNEKWQFLCCPDLIASETTCWYRSRARRKGRGRVSAHEADEKPTLISESYWDFISNNNKDCSCSNLKGIPYTHTRSISLFPTETLYIQLFHVSTLGEAYVQRAPNAEARPLSPVSLGRTTRN